MSKNREKSTINTKKVVHSLKRMQQKKTLYIWVNCARIVRFDRKKSKKIKVNMKKI